MILAVASEYTTARWHHASVHMLLLLAKRLAHRRVFDTPLATAEGILGSPTLVPQELPEGSDRPVW